MPRKPKLPCLPVELDAAVLDACKIQALILEKVDSKGLALDCKAIWFLARAWCDLEERKRILRGILAPGFARSLADMALPEPRVIDIAPAVGHAALTAGSLDPSAVTFYSAPPGEPHATGNGNPDRTGEHRPWLAAAIARSQAARNLRRELAGKDRCFPNVAPLPDGDPLRERIIREHTQRTQSQHLAQGISFQAGGGGGDEGGRAREKPEPQSG